MLLCNSIDVLSWEGVDVVCVCDGLMWSLVPGGMEELQSLDPRRQELLEARFMGAAGGGSTGGSTGSASLGAKVRRTLT